MDLDEKENPTPEDLENDEMSEARQAVVEGQAMVVLVDYMLEPTGQTIAEFSPARERAKRGHAGRHGRFTGTSRMRRYFLKKR